MVTYPRKPYPKSRPRPPEIPRATGPAKVRTMQFRFQNYLIVRAFVHEAQAILGHSGASIAPGTEGESVTIKLTWLEFQRHAVRLQSLATHYAGRLVSAE